MDLAHVLQNYPEAIKWSKSHTLHLNRNANHELGIMLNTYKSNKRRETYTVVTRVKEECQEKDPRRLSAGFRVLKICKDKIHTWELDRVEAALKKLKDTPGIPVKLKLCAPKEYKQRFIVNNNNNISTTSLVGIRPAPPLSPQCIARSPTSELPQSMRQHPKPLGSVVLKGAPANAVTHHHQGDCAGSLTPVDDNMPHFLANGGSERGARRRGDTLENFSSLEDIKDAEEQLLVNEAINRPWNIRWAPKIETKTITRSRDRPELGINYRLEVNPGDSQDKYCIIDGVKPHSPALNILRCGDLVHSVNSYAVVDKYTLKRQIQSSQTAPIKLCIQRPEAVRIRDLAEQSKPNKLSEDKNDSCSNNEKASADLASLALKSLDARTLPLSDIVINTDPESLSTNIVSNHSHRKLPILPTNNLSMNGSVSTVSSNRGLPKANNSLRSSSKKSVTSTNSSVGKQKYSTNENTAKSVVIPNVSNSPKPSLIPKFQTPPPHTRTVARAQSTEDIEFTDKTSATPAMPSFPKGHRRNLSDSSSMFYAQKMNGLTTHEGARPKTSTTSHSSKGLDRRGLNPSDLSTRLDDDLNKWWKALFKRSTEHFPYVRLIQLNTSDSHNMHIHNRVSSLLKVERGLMPCGDPHSFRGNFAISGNGMKCLISSLNAYSIEDIILARYGSSYLKDLKYVLDNRSSILKHLRLSKSNVNQLIGGFLDNPLEPDAHLLGLDSLVLNFSEVCHPEYNVLYSDNSIFIVTVDVQKFSSEVGAKDELGRISICLNNIRLRCKNAQVCFVIASSMTDCDDCESEQIAADYLAQLCNTKQICGECGQGKLIIHQNEATMLALFNLAIPTHVSHLQQVLLESVKSVVYSGIYGKKFPLLALKLNQMLQEEEASPITTEITSKLRKLYPEAKYMDDVMRHVLSSLHAAGKLINPSEIGHGAVNDKLLQMFILHRPRALIQCMKELRLHHPNGIFHEYSTMGRPTTRHNLSLLNDPSLIHYLQLFHCIERINSEEYRYLSENPFRWPLKTPHHDQPMASLFRLDFDGFLPLVAVNMLLCKLALELGGELELRGGCCGVYRIPALGTVAEMELDPQQSIGAIRIYGHGGKQVYKAFERVTPDWLTVLPDYTQNGFTESFESVSRYGLQTPVAKLPLDLLRMISLALHPTTSTCGNDVRLLAELLSCQQLTKLHSLQEDATINVLTNYIQQVNSNLTLGQLVAIVNNKMQRKDVGRKIQEWMANHGIPYQ